MIVCLFHQAREVFYEERYGKVHYQ